MLEFIQNIASRLQQFGAGAYWIISLIVYLETFIVIGQFIPGTILLAFVGFLCYLQVYEFENMLFSIFVGHYLGEVSNYYLGRIKGRSLFSESSRFLKPRFLEMAEQRFEGGGAKILILFQFTGFLRPFVSFAAGATHYPVVRFLVVMAVGAFLWSIAPLGLGFLLGESWQQAVHYFEGFSILLLVLIPAAFISAWLIRRLLEHAGVLGGWLERFSRTIHRSGRYQRIASYSPRLFQYLEARLSLTKPWGIGASLGFTISALLFALFLAVMRNVRTGDLWPGIDIAVVNLLGQLRRPAADQYFDFFTQLGSAPSLIVMGVAAALFCVLAKQYKSLVVFAGSILVSLMISRLTSFLHGRTPPENFLDTLAIYAGGFPSSHASLAVAVLGSLYYWLWNHPGRVRLRVILAFLIVLFVLLISFSRVYLGILFPSEVLGGYCLGTAALIVAATVARNSMIGDVPRRADWPAFVIISAGVAFAMLAQRQSPALPATREIFAGDRVNYTDQLDALAALPRHATGVTGKPVLPINIIMFDEPTSVVAVCRKAEWESVAPNAFFTRRISQPLFPAFVESVPAEHVLEKHLEHGRMVLRLWPTTRTVKNRVVWVGSVVLEERVPKMFGMVSFRIMPDVDKALVAFEREVSGLFPLRIPFRKRDLYLWKYPHFTHGEALFVGWRPVSREK